MGEIIKREKLDAFLKDLVEVSKKHGIWIHGCGCCGSPFLMSGTQDGDIFDGCENLSSSEDGTRYYVDMTKGENDV